MRSEYGLNQRIKRYLERKGLSHYREVYFVEAIKLGLVKIGWAEDSALRLSSLQVGSPDKLVLRGVLVTDDAPGLERSLHEKFKHLRRHGEWFEPDEEMRAYMRDCLFERTERIRRRKIVWDRKPRGPEPEPVFTFHTRDGETLRATMRRFAAEAEAAGIEFD